MMNFTQAFKDAFNDARYILTTSWLPSVAGLVLVYGAHTSLLSLLKMTCYAMAISLFHSSTIKKLVTKQAFIFDLVFVLLAFSIIYFLQLLFNIGVTPKVEVLDRTVGEQATSALMQMLSTLIFSIGAIIVAIAVVWGDLKAILHISVLHYVKDKEAMAYFILIYLVQCAAINISYFIIPISVVMITGWVMRFVFGTPPKPPKKKAKSFVPSTSHS